MLWVGVLTGLRWGEVAGIRVAAVDLLRGELKVVEQRKRDLDGDDVTPDDDVTAEPKSAAGVRTLSIPGALVAMFSEHMASRGLTGADAEALVFVAKRGGPLNYSSWRQRVWVPACERAPNRPHVPRPAPVQRHGHGGRQRRPQDGADPVRPLRSSPHDRALRSGGDRSRPSGRRRPGRQVPSAR